ncbi:4-hydroxy-tetrahydrodipicolinate synthase [Thalassotalea sp. Y01]|uniref:4-hydroxy-tetrahydrodipicolinate synthase n=1 Tax=Thalassotalea sp. Y01 TaxID=2729613 RepID=UPI00145D5DFF|nr:4-hydroxy-tetrahydrodipicolinate synthase [Thalassotalea sp. Y01]NMP15929.1 4-hydroxy-tetrahydrodipicolinate synthase [Thalassotalea sp. Y01]
MTTFQLDDFPLWTALVTPFNDAGEIDYDSLAKIVEDQVQAGNGILICGSTGEGLAIEQHEQYQIVKFICDLQPQVPLMVAVGGANLAAQSAWIEQCNSLPIHSYLLTAPLYTKPGIIGQTNWFKALMDIATKPCMIYNVPSRTGVSIPVETVQNLAEHPNLWAMKEASGDINEFLGFVEAAPNMKMYSGEDALIPYLASAGAVGLVSVCANAWPEATHLYVRQALTGQGASLFPVWYNAISPLFEVANPIPVKVLMHKQGVISSPVLRAPLTHLELASDSKVLAADTAITEWLCNSRNNL